MQVRIKKIDCSDRNNEVTVRALQEVGERTTVREGSLRRFIKTVGNGADMTF